MRKDQSVPGPSRPPNLACAAKLSSIERDEPVHIAGRHRSSTTAERGKLPTHLPLHGSVLSSDVHHIALCARANERDGGKRAIGGGRSPRAFSRLI